MTKFLAAPVSLKTEYLVDPIGLTEREPRFSWMISDPRPGAMQSAYQIRVGTRPESGDLWDTGKVAGSQSHFVVYAGKALVSRQKAYWQVRSYDAGGAESAWSAPAYFELGLLEQSEYAGKWIASSIVGGPQNSTPVPHIRKAFTLAGKIASARLYITALGLYDVKINGKSVSDDVFAPGWTDYSKRVYVQVHDVTALLNQGANAIGVLLNDGWYSGFIAWKNRQNWGDRPKLRAQLEVTFADGTKQTLATDASWKTATGAILASEFLMGEQVDQRLSLGDFSAVNYDDSAWQNVIVPEVQEIKLECSPVPMVRRIEELAPVSISRKRSGRYIVDFGQNMVGRVRLTFAAPAGHTLKMRFAEILTNGTEGDMYLTNMRAARNLDVYTSAGSTPENPDVFEPVFTFRGFRYAEIENYPGELRPENIRGIVLHTPMTSASTFECSEPLLNQLHHNIIWGHKGNFVNVPTDCPQRDERLGWTGDAQVFIRTATLNFDVNAFFAKWITDLLDTQCDNGAMPSVAPNRNFTLPDGGPAWGDAGIICPWTIHLAYADTRVLERAYPGMQKFMKFMAEINSINNIRCHPDLKHHCYGDWLSMDAPPGNNSGGTPNDLIGTAYFAYTAGLLAKIADILGHHDDAERYRATFTRVREAFVNRYITHDGMVINHTQTVYILALHFGLMPENLIPVALQELIRNIERHDNHLTTGFVGTPYLLFALSDFGRSDMALKLLLQKTFPSWLYPVLNGATTIWERWDGWTRDKGFQNSGMNSFNHYAYGAVGHWMMTRLVGIELDENAPAGKHLVIRPELVKNHPLAWAKGSTMTPHGNVTLEWQREGDTYTVKVVIPANTTATLKLPGQAPREIAAGEHQVTCLGQ